MLTNHSLVALHCIAVASPRQAGGKSHGGNETKERPDVFERPKDNAVGTSSSIMFFLSHRGPDWFAFLLSCFLAFLLSCFLAFLLSCFLAFLLSCFLFFVFSARCLRMADRDSLNAPAKTSWSARCRSCWRRCSS